MYKRQLLWFTWPFGFARPMAVYEQLDDRARSGLVYRQLLRLRAVARKGEGDLGAPIHRRDGQPSTAFRVDLSPLHTAGPRFVDQSAGLSLIHI